MHFRRPPVQSTLKLVREAPLEKLETGTRAVSEIVGYPDGQFRITTSEVTGRSGSRQIRQRGFLMFIDADEAKDAVDLFIDRVDAEAKADPGTTPRLSLNPSTVEVARFGVAVVKNELTRRGCRVQADPSSRSANQLRAWTPSGRAVQVYVKSKRRGDWQGDTSRANPRTPDRNESMYWVLVDLEQAPPSFYIVPNWWMENDIYAAHAEYLANHGGTRAVNPKSRHHAIRLQRVEQWLERWHELGL